MSTPVSTDLRCPHCAAHLPAGAEWCSLCHADLRPGAQPPADPSPPSPPTSPAAEPDAEAAPGRSTGKHARRAVSKEDVERTADALLAELAAAEAVNPLGRFSGLVDTPAKKVGLMVGGTVVAMLALFVLMAVLGALL